MISGESNRADCYLSLFANRTFRYVVTVMVYLPMVTELIVMGDLNGDFLRTSRVAVAMLGFRTSLHTLSCNGERVDIRQRLMG